jgi:hypothetical protein
MNKDGCSLRHIPFGYFDLGKSNKFFTGSAQRIQQSKNHIVPIIQRNANNRAPQAEQLKSIKCFI